MALFESATVLEETVTQPRKITNRLGQEGGFPSVAEMQASAARASIEKILLFCNICIQLGRLDIGAGSTSKKNLLKVNILKNIMGPLQFLRNRDLWHCNSVDPSSNLGLEVPIIPR